MNQKSLVVIGGGAAGFFCAVNAARMNPALQVTLVEKTGKLLSKVKVSGGGRCNVTHACFSIADMVKKYPRGASFLKKAFHHFFTTDTIEWFRQRGVALKTEADGRMFPVTDSSQTIIDSLLKEANKYQVNILMNAEVKTINHNNGKFVLELQGERKLEANYICCAGGGYPKTIQFDWLTKPGHSIEEPVPSLFTFNMPGNAITALMGVVAENVSVKINGTKLQEQGPLLITHWGMSGPAILKLSAWGARELQQKNYAFTITVNWLSSFNENTLREKLQQLRFEIATQKIVNRNPFQLPARLWEYLLEQSGVVKDIRWADLPGKEQNKLIKNLCAQEFAVKGKTTFKEEFVTAGGILLSEIDHNTMQSKKVPGLFFAGEVMDVDGITGGFNFQNAWTTGWIAAKTISTLE
ncbi:BaiN/RdsA family NAD(P)/FAD-dependent oxidoreductase [Ferruginibacter sp.]